MKNPWKGINKKHGFTCSKEKLRFYRCYLSMKRRCENPHDSCYSFYGQRGIKNKWSSFEEFKNDMFVSYKVHVTKFGEKDTTLERIDSSGDYCKYNCKWATRLEQSRNRKSARIETYKGESLPLWRFEEKYKLRNGILRSRLFKGFSIKEAIEKPVIKRNRT